MNRHGIGFARYFLLLGVIFGFVFLIVGWKLNQKGKYLEEHCTVEVTAVCIQNERIEHYDSDDGSRSITYKPTFVYGYGDKDYTQESNVSSSNYDKYIEGKEYTIKINPNNPTEYLLDKDNVWKFIGYIFEIMGLIFIIVWSLIFFGMKRVTINSVNNQNNYNNPF